MHVAGFVFLIAAFALGWSWYEEDNLPAFIGGVVFLLFALDCFWFQITYRILSNRALKEREKNVLFLLHGPGIPRGNFAKEGVVVSGLEDIADLISQIKGIEITANDLRIEKYKDAEDMTRDVILVTQPNKGVHGSLNRTFQT
jgi:hypothetical protein